MRTRIGRWSGRAMIAAVVCSAGAVWAQDDAPVDPLAGPSVETDQVPWESQGFTMGMDGRRGGGNDPRVLRWVGDVFESMASESASAGVRLTPEQVRTMDLALAEHDATVRAYREEHAEELRSLRDSVGFDGGQQRPEPQRGARGRVQGDEPRPTDEEALARQRLREINRGGPTPEAAYGAVWATLDDAQRAHVGTELERLSEENLAAAGTGMAEGRGQRGAGMVDTDALDERLRALTERLMQLPEAERARLITLLERMMDREPGDSEEPMQRRGRRGGNAGAGDGDAGPGGGDRRRNARPGSRNRGGDDPDAR